VGEKDFSLQQKSGLPRSTVARKEGEFGNGNGRLMRRRRRRLRRGRCALAAARDARLAAVTESPSRGSFLERPMAGHPHWNARSRARRKQCSSR